MRIQDNISGMMRMKNKKKARANTSWLDTVALAETNNVILLSKAISFEKSRERLVRAITRMDEGLREQKEYGAAFRSVIAELMEKNDQLGGSCRLLGRAAGKIDVKPLHGKSLRLARIAGCGAGD